MIMEAAPSLTAPEAPNEAESRDKNLWYWNLCYLPSLQLSWKEKIGASSFRTILFLSSMWLLVVIIKKKQGIISGENSKRCLIVDPGDYEKTIFGLILHSNGLFIYL